MGKKGKTGKQRKDKFYHLAKESGYRARSAFKLIQLNRKFGFLQESRVLVDLCAAPGGWLQVAANNMPLSSIVIGVDLVPIKPIPNVTTFTADITTDHCKELIRKELKTWKADVVLNDGAPNVGTAWVHDAFSQAQLALSALKLASEILNKGGWFVTKIFRSKDYTALLWIFEQLFKKVHSTKPHASRNESAEIFVVCEGYLAPDKLDEKFLNPKHVFSQIEQETKVKLDILRPEKKTRQRDGYADNNVGLHTTVTGREYIDTADAVDFLSTINKIEIKDEQIKQHVATTPEVLQCCEDIKVLGKKELKTLLSWRKKLRKELKSAEGEESGKGEIPDRSIPKEIEMTEEEQEENLKQTISDLRDQELKDLKKKKKRVTKMKKKIREGLANKLEAATEESGVQEQDLFVLKSLNKVDMDNVETEDPVLSEDEAESSELEFDSDEGSDKSEDSDAYVYGDDELYEKPDKKRKLPCDNKEKLPKRKKNDDTDNPLIVEIDEADNAESTAVTRKAKQWYQKDIFKDVEEENDDLDDDYDIEQMLMNYKKKGGKVIESNEKKEPENDVSKTEETRKAFDVQDAANDKSGYGNDLENNDEDSDDEDNDDSDNDSDCESEIDDRSISQGRKDHKESQKETTLNKKGFEIAPQQEQYLDPEELALGTALVTSKKRKRDIIDAGYNRYTFNDEGLPAWFTEDENKHVYRQAPVTREEVEYYKQRMRDLNAKPIKKVIEAKAKKKSKMISKLNKVRKKAQGILDSNNESVKEQQHQIQGIYKKAGLLKKKKAKPTYVVAKKSLAGKKYKRPDGVKGTYKVVDPRLKKDLRAAKNKEKTKGRKKKR